MSERKELPTLAEGERCETCRFWRSWGDSGDAEKSGECHRHAPRPYPQGHSQLTDMTEWPNTGTTDWCGEYQPKQA